MHSIKPKTINKCDFSEKSVLKFILKYQEKENWLITAQ